MISERPGRAPLAALLLSLVLLATACGPVFRVLGIRRTSEPIIYYGLKLPERTADSAAGLSPANGTARPPLTGSLAVVPYGVPGLYGEPRVVYRAGDTQFGVYNNREWMMPLSQQLGLVTHALLRRHPLTTEPALYDPPSRRANTYVWRGTVRHFEEVNRGAEVSVAVHVDAAIVRSADDSVLWSGGAHAERALGQTRDMEVVVGAMSELAQETIGRLIQEASAAVRRPAVRAQSRP